MYVVVVTPNKNGKIELTKDELQKMLDDAYAKGYSEGASKINYYPITVPSWPVTYNIGKEQPLKYDYINCSEDWR